MTPDIFETSNIMKEFFKTLFYKPIFKYLEIENFSYIYNFIFFVLWLIS